MEKFKKHDDFRDSLRNLFLNAADISEFLKVWLSIDILKGDSAKAFDAYYGSYRKKFPLRMQKVYSNQITEAENVVRSLTKPRILEVGCGLGTESLWLAMAGANVTGIDLRSDRLNTAMERKKILESHIGRDLECEFKLESLLDIPEDSAFDLLWLEQTFHHLEPRKQMISKIAKLIRPGGYIVISEANGWNFPLQVQLFLRRGRPKIKTMLGSDGRSHLYGDERITTAGAIKRDFSKVGISTVSVRYFRMFPNKEIFNNLSWLEELPFFSIIPPCFTHFNYVGVRNEEDVL